MFIYISPYNTTYHHIHHTPPASMMSASPRRMVLRASPMACEPTAHAEVTPKLGPCVQQKSFFFFKKDCFFVEGLHAEVGPCVQQKRDCFF